jgi:hypothetical protein
MPHTNKHRFYKLHDIPADESLSLDEIARYSKMPKAALQEVYMKGAGAWRSNLASVRLKQDYSKNPNTKQFPRASRLSQPQWAYARVYAFVMKTRKVFHGADRHIAEKYHLL